jgi:hypothetical protein
MSVAALELQKDIYSTLTGDVTLMAKINGVYDFIPDNKPFPFVRVGEINLTDSGTHTFNGFEVEFVIDLWHRPPNRGKAALHGIMDDIYRLLHKATFSIPNYTVYVSRFISSSIIVEEDNVTYHGITKFRIILGEN